MAEPRSEDASRSEGEGAGADAGAPICEYCLEPEDSPVSFGDLEDKGLLEGGEWRCRRRPNPDEACCPFHQSPEQRRSDGADGDGISDAELSQMFLALVSDDHDSGVIHDHDRTDGERSFLEIVPADGENRYGDIVARRRKQFIGAKFGEFDLTYEDLDAPDRYPIDLREARADRIDWSDARAPVDLEMRGISVSTGEESTTGELSLEGAVVEGEVSLDDADVGEEVLLWGTDVGGRVWLGGADMGGGVWLRDADVGGRVWLDDADMGGGVSLYGADVGGRVWLRYADVGGEVSLEDADVGGQVSLYGADVGGQVSLYGADVGGDVTLTGANIGDALALIACSISGSLVASKLSVGSDVRESGSVLEIRDSRIGRKVALDQATINGELTIGRPGDETTRIGNHLTLAAANVEELDIETGALGHPAIRVVDLTDITVETATLRQQRGPRPVIYDFAGGTVGDVDLDLHDGIDREGGRYDLLRFVDTEFESMEFSRHRREFLASDWALHETIQNDDRREGELDVRLLREISDNRDREGDDQSDRGVPSAVGQTVAEALSDASLVESCMRELDDQIGARSPVSPEALHLTLEWCVPTDDEGIAPMRAVGRRALGRIRLLAEEDPLSDRPGLSPEVIRQILDYLLDAAPGGDRDDIETNPLAGIDPTATEPQFGGADGTDGEDEESEPPTEEVLAEQFDDGDTRDSIVEAWLPIRSLYRDLHEEVPEREAFDRAPLAVGLEWHLQHNEGLFDADSDDDIDAFPGDAAVHRFLRRLEAAEAERRVAESWDPLPDDRPDAQPTDRDRATESDRPDAEHGAHRSEQGDGYPDRETESDGGDGDVATDGGPSTPEDGSPTDASSAPSDSGEDDPEDHEPLATCMATRLAAAYREEVDGEVDGGSGSGDNQADDGTITDDRQPLDGRRYAADGDRKLLAHLRAYADGDDPTADADEGTDSEDDPTADADEGTDSDGDSQEASEPTHRRSDDTADVVLPSFSIDDARLEATYAKAKTAADGIGADDAAGEFFVREQRYAERQEWQQLRQEYDSGGLRSILSNLRLVLSPVQRFTLRKLTRYGEQPRRVLGWWGLTIAACWLLYYAWFTLDNGGPVLQSGRFVDAGVLSVGAFATLLPNGSATIPSGEPAIPDLLVLIVELQGLLGVFLLSMFVFTLSRSVRR